MNSGGKRRAVSFVNLYSIEMKHFSWIHDGNVSDNILMFSANFL